MKDWRLLCPKLAGFSAPFLEVKENTIFVLYLRRGTKRYWGNRKLWVPCSVTHAGIFRRFSMGLFVCEEGSKFKEVHLNHRCAKEASTMRIFVCQVSLKSIRLEPPRLSSALNYIELLVSGCSLNENPAWWNSLPGHTAQGSPYPARAVYHQETLKSEKF